LEKEEGSFRILYESVQGWGKHSSSKMHCKSLSVPRTFSEHSHKSRILADPKASSPFPSLNDLPDCPNIISKFDCSSLKFKDFLSVLNSRRNGSSPGVNKISEKVYKLCPQISSFLFNPLSANVLYISS